MLFAFLVHLFLVTGRNCCQASCPTNLLGRGSYLYVLSDQRTNSSNAKAICSSYAGTLVETIDTEIQSDLIDYAEQRLIPSDLTTIDVWLHPKFDNVFKYRPRNVTIHDEENVTLWKRPRFGRIKSFKLYKSNSTYLRFSKPVYFYYVAKRDIFANAKQPSYSGWKPNFTLYGGTSKTHDVITLYNFFNNLDDKRSSNIFFNPINEQEQNLSKQTNGTYYIPDISIFVGAQSKKGQDAWSWQNGTRITNGSYSPSNQSVCQQMSWPLTYQDDINLRGKLCEEKAYFICQNKFVMNILPASCFNEAALEVSWKNLSHLFSNNSVHLSVELRVNKTYVSLEDSNWNPLRNFSFILRGLKRNTTYTIQARILSNACGSINLTVSGMARTQASLINVAELMKNARVKNASAKSSCMVSWDSVPTAEQYSVYITGTNTHNNFSKTYYFFSGSSSEYPLDWSRFPSGATVRFQFQSFKSTCGSEIIAQVVGECTKENQEQIYYFSTTISISIAGFAAVVMFLTVIIFRCKTREQATDVSHQQQGDSSHETDPSAHYERWEIHLEEEIPHQCDGRNIQSAEDEGGRSNRSEVYEFACGDFPLAENEANYVYATEISYIQPQLNGSGFRNQKAKYHLAGPNDASRYANANVAFVQTGKSMEDKKNAKCVAKKKRMDDKNDITNVPSLSRDLYENDFV